MEKSIRDDAPFIQKLLDKRGDVHITEKRVWLLGNTLRIRSGTRLTADDGVVFRAMPRSLCSLIENEHFAGGGTDTDIVIRGGVWDGNCDEQGLNPLEYTLNRNEKPYVADHFTGKMMRFAHVEKLTIEAMTLKDPVSYGMQIADARTFLVRDIAFDYNCRFGTTDGVHINGPAFDGVIRNVHGLTNDDMVSLTTDDEPHAEVTNGPIDTVLVDGVIAQNGYTGVRLLSCGHPLTNVTVRDVRGTYRHNAVSLTHHYVHPGQPIWMDQITIEQIDASKSDVRLSEACFTYWDRDCLHTDAMIWIASGIRAGKICISNVKRDERTSSTAATIRIDERTELEEVSLSEISQSCLHKAAPALLDCAGEVDRMILR